MDLARSTALFSSNDPTCQDRGESCDVDGGTQEVVLQARLQILHKYHTTERDRRLFTKNSELQRGRVKHREKLGVDGDHMIWLSHTDKSVQSLVISSLRKDKRDDQ